MLALDAAYDVINTRKRNDYPFTFIFTAEYSPQND